MHIRLIHETTGGEWMAPERAVEHYRSKGWRPADEVETPETETDIADDGENSEES